MGKKIALSVAVLVALVIAAYAYVVWRDAEAMRAKIYRPLYQEVSQVQEVVLASNISRAIPNGVITSVQKDPRWHEVPEALREKATATYDKAYDCQSEMVVARIQWIAIAGLSGRGIRTQSDDQAWLDKANQSSAPAPAASGARKFLHREAQEDKTDPAHPRRIPGGPVWQMADWITFPQNVADFEKEWSENEFLYLTDGSYDQWQYRITHDDLRRNHLTLEQFLSNMLQGILNFGRIRGFREYCQAVIPMLDSLKKDLAEKAR